MKTLALILGFVFVADAHALLYLEGFGMISGASIKDWDETQSTGNTYTHDGWSMGIGAGGRVGLGLGPFKFGGVLEFQKVQFEGERTDPNANNANALDKAKDYDLLQDRTALGGFFIFELPALPLRVIGEYYASINSKLSYSEPNSENPFQENDEINGNGYGIGLGWTAGPVKTGFILRRIKYDEFKLAGSTISLPSTQYKEITVTEVVIQGGMAIDLF